jgi:hypothetical protein
VILDDVVATIALTQEDDDPEEDAMWAQLNMCLVNNPINIEFTCGTTLR